MSVPAQSISACLGGFVRWQVAIRRGNHMGNLKGKCALVTGSTSGIGLAIARHMAAAGANLVMHGFGDLKEIGMLRDDITTTHGVRTFYSGSDLAHPAAIVGMMTEIHDDFAPIDILVNNAGIQHVAPLDTFPVEQWDRIMAVNLNAVFHTIRLALPGMRTRKWGRIVNIASTHGLVASPLKSAYVAAKHGVVGLTKSAALEAAADYITVNAVAPGYVRTSLVEKQIADISRQTGQSLEKAADGILREKHPSRRFVEMTDVAATVVFLCSSGADSITGATLPVDAGWTAQ